MKNRVLTAKILPVVVVVLFFASFLWIGIQIYKDFGTYIDEAAQVTIGERNYQYLKTGDAAQINWRDWDHGAVFELFTIFTTRFLPPNWHYADMYFNRHLMVFLTFWASGFAFFWLVKKQFNSWKMGLLGCTFLFMSPVIFGNAFFNSKDIPLLSAYIVGLLTLTWFVERPNLWTVGLHAMVCGLCIAIRVPGVILTALTVGILVLQFIVPNRKELMPKPGRMALLGIVFLVLTAGFMILFFPSIWPDPIRLIGKAYMAMTHRSWNCCCNLMLGNCYNSEQIPWFHLPVWMGVTTPPYYLVLFALGTVTALSAFLVKPWLYLTVEKRSALIALGALFLPVMAIIIGRSVIYNGWRHMYFVYAPFLLLAMQGFHMAWQWLHKLGRPKLAAGVLGLITVASISSTAVFMIQAHPYEFVYFNFLAGKDMLEVKQRFELDYWGLSFAEGLRYILKNDMRSPVLVASNQNAMPEYAFILPDEDQARLKFDVTPAQADYYIANYYMHPQDYEYPNEVFSVKVGNAKILSVFKLKP